MMRSVVPLVPSSISYHHHDNPSGATAATIYVNQSSAVAAASNVAISHHHATHLQSQQQQHVVPPPCTAPSPSQTPQQIPPPSHTPSSFQTAPTATVVTQNGATHYQSAVMCPTVIQAPPHGAPPHHMITQAQAHTVQQYIQQHPQG